MQHFTHASLCHNIRGLAGFMTPTFYHFNWLPDTNFCIMLIGCQSNKETESEWEGSEIHCQSLSPATDDLTTLVSIYLRSRFIYGTSGLKIKSTGATLKARLAFFFCVAERRKPPLKQKSEPNTTRSFCFSLLLRAEDGYF